MLEKLLLQMISPLIKLILSPMIKQIKFMLMKSIVFQTRFRISKTNEVSNVGFRIIPIEISSVKDRNDYTPTPVTDDKVIDAIIGTMRENGKGFGVEEYPLSWK